MGIIVVGGVCFYNVSIAMKPHPTLSKGEGFKALLKVSPFGEI
jgi:hypothetical protein